MITTKDAMSELARQIAHAEPCLLQECIDVECKCGKCKKHMTSDYYDGAYNLAMDWLCSKPDRLVFEIHDSDIPNEEAYRLAVLVAHTSMNWHAYTELIYDFGWVGGFDCNQDEMDNITEDFYNSLKNKKAPTGAGA